jgi:hypothetical protein
MKEPLVPVFFNCLESQNIWFWFLILSEANKPRVLGFLQIFKELMVLMKELAV